MAASYDSIRLRNQRQMDRRLTADHRQLARVLAGLVVQAATARDEAGTPIIPPSRKVLDDLKAAVWERVRAYYIGPGRTDALDGPNPRSPYALLLVEGIAQATRIQAERQAALVRRLVKDPEVVRWLTGPRPMLPTREMAPTIAGRITELTLTPTRDTLGGLRGVDGRIDTDRARAALVRPRGTYDAFHQWVDPNGYRLSDRIWRTSIDVRSRIDLLLDYEVARGTSAVDIANLLEPFLTPGARGQRTVKPYGREGSFSARRLARTEISSASHRATVNASIINPFVGGVKWNLSLSHPKIDICDDLARGGPNGDGVYAPENVPAFPHPHCLCSQLPVPVGSTADLVQTLKADIQAARGNLIDAASGGDPARARALQGTLSPEYLTQAMMSGNLDDAVAQAVRQAQTVRPDVARPAIPKAPAKPTSYLEMAVKQRAEMAERVKDVTYDTAEGRRVRERLLRATDKADDRVRAIWDKYSDRKYEVHNRLMDAAATFGEDDPRTRKLSAAFDKIVAQREREVDRVRAKARETIFISEKDRRFTSTLQYELDPSYIHTPSGRDVVPREVLSQHVEAAEFINKVTDQGLGGKINLHYEPGRAFHNGHGRFIQLDTYSPTSTAVHELGHAVEYANHTEQQKKIQRFLHDRIGSEMPIRLMDDNPAYDEFEIAYRDRFDNAYIGKVYSEFKSSEVVSMGVQYLYQDPLEFATRDPDFFDFTISFLRGKL